MTQQTRKERNRVYANEVGLKSYSHRREFRTNSRHLTLGKRTDGQYGLIRRKTTYKNIEID